MHELNINARPTVCKVIKVALNGSTDVGVPNA